MSLSWVYPKVLVCHSKAGLLMAGLKQSRLLGLRRAGGQHEAKAGIDNAHVGHAAIACAAAHMGPIGPPRAAVHGHPGLWVVPVALSTILGERAARAGVVAIAAARPLPDIAGHIEGAAGRHARLADPHGGWATKVLAISISIDREVKGWLAIPPRIHAALEGGIEAGGSLTLGLAGQADDIARRQLGGQLLVHPAAVGDGLVPCHANHGLVAPGIGGLLPPARADDRLLLFPLPPFRRPPVLSALAIGRFDEGFVL